eukprot:1694418-Amphidinium_carterae.1
MELYTVLPEQALRMWITCGKIPMSYMQHYTEPRHTYYNFHRESRLHRARPLLRGDPHYGQITHRTEARLGDENLKDRHGRMAHEKGLR